MNEQSAKLSFDGPMPFTHQTIEQVGNEANLHEVRLLCDDMFDDSNFVSRIERVGPDSKKHVWLVSPVVETTFTDGEAIELRLARCIDRKVRRDPNSRSDTFLIIGEAIESPLAELSVQTNMRPFEKVIDHSNLESFDVSEEQSSLLERTARELARLRVESLRANKAAHAQTDAEKRAIRNRRIDIAQRFGLGAVVGVVVVGSIVGMGFAVISEAEKVETPVIHPTAQKLAKATEGTFTGIGQSALVLERDEETYSAIRAELSADFKDANITEEWEQFYVDAKSQLGLPSEVSVASLNGRYDKNVYEWLALPTKDCHLVMFESATTGDDRIVGVETVTKDSARGDYSVEVGKKEMRVDLEDEADYNAQIVAANVCKVGSVKDNPSEDTYDWAIMRAVTAEEAGRLRYPLPPETEG